MANNPTTKTRRIDLLILALVCAPGSFFLLGWWGPLAVVAVAGVLALPCWNRFDQGVANHGR